MRYSTGCGHERYAGEPCLICTFQQENPRPDDYGDKATAHDMRPAPGAVRSHVEPPEAQDNRTFSPPAGYGCKICDFCNVGADGRQLCEECREGLKFRRLLIAQGLDCAKHPRVQVYKTDPYRERRDGRKSSSKPLTHRLKIPQSLLSKI